MKKYFKGSIFLIYILALTACNLQAVAPTATATPAPSKTPAATFTPLPTDPPTATALPPVALGERQKVDAGGYSLQVPLGFEVKIHDTQTLVSNKDQSILITLAITPRKDDTQTSESLLKGFLANVGKDVKDLQTSKFLPVKVGELDGLAADVSGTVFAAKSTGRATVTDTGKNGFFVVFALAVDGSDGSRRWQTEGQQIQDAVLGSIEFFEPVQASATSSGTCVISTDPTYGYTQENPIKVGGDDFDGPPREEAFLDNLLGPKGEKLTYTRQGSNSFGDTILDTYIIKGLAKDITLYIDEYAFTEAQAPVGFTCASAFSLTKP